MRLLFRCACLLFCLGVGAIAWVLLTPRHQNAVMQAPPIAPVAAEEQQEAPEPPRKVRIVYADATTVGLPVGSTKVDNRVDPASPPPSQAEPGQGSSTAQASDAGAAVPGTRASVDLNTASVDALNRIPGAGSIGRTIVAHRPYRSVDELLSKRVVRRSVFDRIKLQLAAE